MLPTYNFICIPLDTRDPTVMKSTFDVRIVSELQFPMNASHDPATVRGALAQHPLLTRPPSQPLSGFIWDYQSWDRNGRSINPAAAARVSFTFAGTSITLDSALGNLLNYLGASTEPLTATLLPTNSRYENISDDEYVDVIKAADELRVLKHALRVSALNQLRASIDARQSLTREANTVTAAALTDLGPVSFALAKSIDSSSHASLLAALVERDDRRAEQWLALFGKHARTVSSIRTAVNKITKRISAGKNTFCREMNELTAIGTAGDTHTVPLSDPNVAIHAALKNSLLGESCGLVTRWSVESSIPVLGSGNYVIQLDNSSLLYDRSKVEVQNAVPTAFRRETHTHPVAFADLATPETRNGALACLNETGPIVRYRAASVNSETSLAKEVILQAANSLSGPTAADKACSFGNFNPPLQEVDERPPQLLRNDQYGSAEPETSGVVFSAPVEDLIVPLELRRLDRKTVLPCLFLEDLWIGYRLDLKQDVGQRFTSTHKQEQRILFSQSRKSVSGLTEDYIEREQLDDQSLGHTSTELTTYNGFSSGQAKDYLRFLGTARPETSSPQQPFEVAVTRYGKTERLIFGKTYEYRLRNVFLGSVSADSEDSRLDDGGFKERYQQQFPFFRAKTLRPGEALSSSFENNKESDRRTIYLTVNKPESTITIVPTPIDIDSSRYHGILFRTKDELIRHSGRKHVGDLGKFFKELPPAELNYFYDPDVYGIKITVTLVNGNDEQGPQDFIYEDNTYCGLSKHLILDPMSEYYGQQGDWEKFRPIVIRFRTSAKLLPSIQKARASRGSRRIEIEVPPAGELHVSIAPIFDASLLSKTASHLASSGQLRDIGLAGAAEDALPIPSIARETLKVIHAIAQPRRTPVLIGESPHVSAVQPADGEISIADRKLDSEFGSIFGRIEIDAASTKEVRLEAAWMDVNDNPAQERYTLESGTAATTPRSVIFRAVEPVKPSAEQFKKFFLKLDSSAAAAHSLIEYRVGSSRFGFIEQFMLQCAEDKVFLGRPPAGCPQDGLADVTNRLNLKDQRRKLLKTQAVAVGRFAEHFAKAQPENELRSKQVIVDVPSTVKMSAPKISHVVPLRKALRTGDNSEGSSQAAFGIRIYVHKPAFQSGVGERLAIGCFTGGDSPVGPEAELKYVTQWGEDPIERAGLQATMRMPRATDFVAPDNEEEVGFVEELYPPSAVGGAAPVIYRDNVAFEPEKAAGKRRFVSVASYALRCDERQRLWYADVYVKTGFFGWCGMAIYRHQPHALPNRQLSQTWDWAYAAILYGEPVAWVERQGNLHLTIGPIYDDNVQFELDSLPYNDGISNALSQTQRIPQQLESYRVGRATYFEAVVSKEIFDWTLIKRRFGYAVASRHLGQ